MIRKRDSAQQLAGTYAPRRMLDGHVDLRRQHALAGAWRVADLLEMSSRSPLMLDALCQIHRAACNVIGGNLSRRALDRDGLKRLQASVMRQADQVRQLQNKLTAVKADAGLQDEAAKLLDFFDSTLTDITRKLGSRD